MHPENEIYTAFKKCEKIAKTHYENFPVGSLLIPRAKRKYVYAIYAFARYADDIADSNKESAKKFDRLNEFELELIKTERNELENLEKDTSYIFIALHQTMIDLKIPAQEFYNLLIAFKQDCIVTRYEYFDQLIEYSAYSANPIGHLILYLFNYRPDKDLELFNLSDRICTGLQLINFWQDVKPDLEIDRIYIPKNVMDKFDYTFEDLLSKTENEKFVKVMKELIHETRIFFEEGKPLIRHLKGRLKLEIKATYIGGSTILKKIEKIHYKILSHRVKLSKRDKLKILLKTFGYIRL